MKLFSSAFDATLRRFKITGESLSEASGVSTGAISTFRNDVAGVTTDTLERLVVALEPEAFEFWLSQIAAGREAVELVGRPLDIQTFVHALDGRAASEVLVALAARLRDEAMKKEKTMPQSLVDSSERLST